MGQVIIAMWRPQKSETFALKFYTTLNIYMKCHDIQMWPEGWTGVEGSGVSCEWSLVFFDERIAGGSEMDVLPSLLFSKFLSMFWYASF